MPPHRPPMAGVYGGITFFPKGERTQMKRWWVGCSGFSYKHWKNAFYPQGLPARLWFEYYCERFNTVELNVTFYRMPKPETFSGWYQRSPGQFSFTVKAPRVITHFRKFLNARDDIMRFYDTVAHGLREKLGPVLFQLPPNLVYSEDNLERIVSALDKTFINVIEFRHPSWWRTSVEERLRENNICFCGISYPDLPDEVMRTSDSLYYRFHGVPALYRSPYKISKLKEVLQKVEVKRKVSNVYFYFNNDIDVSAVRNAMQVQKLLGIESLPVQLQEK